MRNIDLTPLMRATVGFDTLDKLFDAAFRDASRDVSYPPYDIIKLGPDKYRIRVAVAGFSENDLEIVVQEDMLIVKGKADPTGDQGEYLHRGIARRAFEHRFRLADQVRVLGAELRNGLLEIELERVRPEKPKGRRIEIRAGDGAR